MIDKLGMEPSPAASPAEAMGALADQQTNEYEDRDAAYFRTLSRRDQLMRGSVDPGQ